MSTESNISGKFDRIFTVKEGESHKIGAEDGGSPVINAHKTCLLVATFGERKY